MAIVARSSGRERLRLRITGVESRLKRRGGVVSATTRFDLRIATCPIPGEFFMQDDVAALFAYDRWANTRVFDACRRLTAEQYVAEPVPGWSSVRSTIYHIAIATEWNLRALAGDPDENLPTEAD